MSKQARTSFFEEQQHCSTPRLTSRSQSGCGNIGNVTCDPGHPAGGHICLDFLFRFFSGVETALFSLKPHQLRRLETNHVSLTKFVKLFRENPRRVRLYFSWATE